MALLTANRSNIFNIAKYWIWDF